MFFGGVKADPVAQIAEAARGEDLGQSNLDEAGFVNGYGLRLL